MFEQHPVPQQISSYQFRLVGDMTLKQFFQLAAGAIVGLIIYSLPIPGFLKWPFIAIAVIGGAAFAFLPIQDRPLEQWLVAFFRSIYSANLFYWKKYDKPPVYFASDNTAPVDGNVLTGPSPQMEVIPTDAATHTLETNEKNFLARLSTMFGGGSTKVTADQPLEDKVVAPPTSTSVQGIVASDSGNIQDTNAFVVPAAALKPHKKEVEVPANTTVEVKPAGFEQSAPAIETAETAVSQTLKAQPEPAAIEAKFSPDAAPPVMPTQPNIIVGQVMDSEKHIVESAILEISDVDGRPARALKTNNAGHFQIVTPVPNGDYTITIEKDGYIFEPVKLHASGEIIEPIAISAKNNGEQKAQ